jgi:hypothetical protein
MADRVCRGASARFSGGEPRDQAMQENTPYRYEFRGTMEIPFQVLATYRAGSLEEARELCHAYACQIVLHDDNGVRGWVKPDGRYELSGRDPAVTSH